MPKPEIIRDHDAIARHHAEYSSGRQAHLDAVDRLVIEQLRPGMRLLDIGSGDGRRLAKITRRVGRCRRGRAERANGRNFRSGDR